MDFGRAFTYAFDDPEWLKKVGIAALVFLIPLVGGIIVMGWGLEITRRVINDDPQPLPDWEDFGGHVSRGFKAFAVSLGYLLPVILVAICGQVVSIGLPAMTGDNNSDLIGTVIMVSGLCMGCFVLIFSLLAGLAIPPALGTLAVTGEVGAAFRFQEIFGLLRAAIGPYLLTLLILALVPMVLMPLGSLLCGIGALIAGAYQQLLNGHLYGQAYKIAKANLGLTA